MTADDTVDRSEELAQREQNTIYLDLPTPELCDPDCHDDEGWVNVAKFTDPKEAVAFIREHIDPYCDDQGRINILTNMPETPKGDLTLLLAVCKEVASMPGKDWLDGQLKLGKAIMQYEGELPPEPPTPAAEMWQALLDAAHTVLGNVIDNSSFGPNMEFDEDAGDPYPRDEEGNAWFDDYFALRQAVHAIDDANLTASGKSTGTVTVRTCDGTVVGVEGLPDGWDYECSDMADDPDDV